MKHHSDQNSGPRPNAAPGGDLTERPADKSATKWTKIYAVFQIAKAAIEVINWLGEHLS